LGKKEAKERGKGVYAIHKKANVEQRSVGEHLERGKTFLWVFREGVAVERRVRGDEDG